MQFTRRRSRKKKFTRWFLFLALLVVCIFAAPPAYRAVSSSYKDWKRERALAQAKQFFAAKDYAKANTALQVALRTDRTSIEVWKTIADITEASGAREAIQQRQQVVLLLPSDADAHVALAMTAMRFGDMFTARDALATVPMNFRGAVNYRRAVALFAMLEGNGSTAEQVLASLMKSNPSDSVRLDYLSVRLSHPDRVIATSARQELAGMVETPALAPAVLRMLMTDAVIRKDFAAATSWAERLLKLPEVSYEDRLAMGTLKLLVEKNRWRKFCPS
jgi:Flp pilus assembly protein TadD